MSVGFGQGQVVARGGDEGEALWVIGGLYSYRALHAETGAYFACEVKAPQGFAIPLHFHDDEEEGFYVASGEATIILGEDARRLSAGGFALAPRGVRHAFRLEWPETTLLLLLSPGPKHEALFRAIGQPAAERVPPPSSEPPDADALAEAAARYGTRIVGPPPLN
jgi:quercetin dioxygenase-like cupin family protein